MVGSIPSARREPVAGRLSPALAMVRRSPWALALSPDELDVVLADVIQREVPAGQFVARSGDVVEHWMGLVDGYAKMSVSSQDGRLSTLTGVGPGVWFGEGSLFKREKRRYDVIALRASRVALLPRRTFDWLRRTSFPFNHYLQDLLNARLSLFIGTLEHDRLDDTDARVAHGLASLFNADLYPTMPRRVSLGQHEIGLLANVSRQRVNVALQRLQDLGLVQIEKGGVVVLDVEGLKDFAG